MLELAILGLLKEQDLHGYELKKRLTETLGVVRTVSFGSLYPALGRLERDGAVRTVALGDTGPALPQTGSIGGELAAFRARAARPRSGRSRKVYGITTRGEELFAELLAAAGPAAEDVRGFQLRLAFARYLSTEARIRLLERRRAQLLERLGSAGARRPSSRRDRYVDSLLEHERQATEHDLSWIEQLLAGEREVHRPAPVEPPPTAAPTLAALAAPTLTGLTARTDPGPRAHTDPGLPARSTQEEPTR